MGKNGFRELPLTRASRPADSGKKHREHGPPAPREFPAGGAAVLDLSGFCLMPAAYAGCQLRIKASTAGATPPRIERHYAVPDFDLL
jgi:hypothetical protein